jgi:dihydroneopterin aldolase
MNDTITLSNMTFFGRHGVYPYEQEHGQRFQVDIEMGADLDQAAQTDQLAATIDYTAVYDTTKRIVENEHYQLIEALCGRIAGVVLEFPHVKQVAVRIRKPAAPVPGALDFVQVALVRSK